jgi:hypothetical protein
MTDTHPPRRFHAFCVGQAKSGTGSLWCVFRDRFRAAHEPEHSALLAKILEERRGVVGRDKMAAWLRQRSEHLQLELDISWFNYFVIDHLVAEFPAARFIVLVRDVYSWLESLYGHLLSREIPADIRAFLPAWFETERHPPGPGEERLRDAGLMSLAASMNVWRRHITDCCARIPPARRLVLRTNELSRSWDRVAEFLGVDAALLNVELGHVNQGTWDGRLSALVDDDLVNDAVARYCADAMSEHFPGVGSLADAYALYED